MKIFCRKCKHLLVDYTRISPNQFRCTNPHNVKLGTLQDNWYQEGLTYSIHINKPSEINSQNNCDWFEPKGE